MSPLCLQISFASTDPYADSTPVGVFPLPGDSPPAGADIDPHVAAMFPEAFCELL